MVTRLFSMSMLLSKVKSCTCFLPFTEPVETGFRVRSHWASNFASASTSNSQTQTQSSLLNCGLNPFHINHKISGEFSCKVNHDVSWSIWMDINKMEWYPIERGTLHLRLQVTHRHRRNFSYSLNVNGPLIILSTTVMLIGLAETYIKGSQSKVRQEAGTNHPYLNAYQNRYCETTRIQRVQDPGE